MPEYLRALIVILVVGGVVVMASKKLLLSVGFDPNAFNSRIWGACISVSAIFLSGNFWLAMGLIALVGYFCASREKNPIALFVMLLIGLPWVEADVSGLGILQHFVTLNPNRVLATVILLPAALTLYREKKNARTLAWTGLDKAVFFYFLLYFCLMLDASTFTNAIRRGFVYPIVDVVLAYFVATRTLDDRQRMRDLLATLLFVGMLHSLLAIFEITRSWLLFVPVPDHLEIFVQFNPYDFRDDGTLRARTSSQHSIILGTALSVIMVLSTAILKQCRSPVKVLIYSIFMCGLLATVSRGPWVGAVVGLLVVALLSATAAKGLLLLACFCGITTASLSFFEVGEKFLSYVPFLGTASTDSVEYRQRLFEYAINVILNNPFFGSYDFMFKLADQGMVQGQGIVDLVNTYIAIGLSGGFTALLLFAAIIALPTFRLWRGHRLKDFQDPQSAQTRSAFLGAIACLTTILATASFIGTIQTFFWLTIAAGFAFSHSKPGFTQIDAK
jgi:hypothetical protein